MGILPEADFPRDTYKDTFLKADDDAWKDLLKHSDLSKRTGNNDEIYE